MVSGSYTLTAMETVVALLVVVEEGATLQLAVVVVAAGEPLLRAAQKALLALDKSIHPDGPLWYQMIYILQTVLHLYKDLPI